MWVLPFSFFFLSAIIYNLKQELGIQCSMTKRGVTFPVFRKQHNAQVLQVTVVGLQDDALTETLVPCLCYSKMLCWMT